MHLKFYLTLAVASIILSSTASPLPQMMIMNGGGDMHRNPVVHGNLGSPDTMKPRGLTGIENRETLYTRKNVHDPTDIKKRTTPTAETKYRDPTNMDEREPSTAEIQRDNPNGIFVDPEFIYPVFPSHKHKDR